jgi:hypothetical protein
MIVEDRTVAAHGQIDLLCKFVVVDKLHPVFRILLVVDSESETMSRPWIPSKGQRPAIHDVDDPLPWFLYH